MKRPTADRLREIAGARDGELGADHLSHLLGCPSEWGIWHGRCLPGALALLPPFLMDRAKPGAAALGVSLLFVPKVASLPATDAPLTELLRSSTLGSTLGSSDAAGRNWLELAGCWAMCVSAGIPIVGVSARIPLGELKELSRMIELSCRELEPGRTFPFLVSEFSYDAGKVSI